MHIHTTKAICEIQVEMELNFRMAQLFAQLRYISEFLF
jgi:hypothetical protein